MLKILIAVDGSDHANRAIDAVAVMARSSLELEAMLVCVSSEPLIYGGFTMATIQKMEEEQKKQQNTILSQAMERAQSLQLRLSDPVRAHGVIANEIVRVAKEHRVDQIAMGTRGMGALGSVMLGSVAQRVIHQSEVPVLLVK